jgi:DnaJ-class molecular chaperone
MIALVIVVLAVVLAYVVSLAVFPWRPCRRCDGKGKLADPVFAYAHRDCSRCNGRGRLPRLGRRVMFRGHKP